MAFQTKAECRAACSLLCDRVSKSLFQCTPVFESKTLCRYLIICVCVLSVAPFLIDFVLNLARSSTVFTPLPSKARVAAKQKQYIEAVRQRQIAFLRARLGVQ